MALVDSQRHHPNCLEVESWEVEGHNRVRHQETTNFWLRSICRHAGGSSQTAAISFHVVFDGGIECTQSV